MRDFTIFSTFVAFPYIGVMKKCLAAFALLLVHTIIYGQGCSDAGMCSVPAYRSQLQVGENSLYRFDGYGITLGAADHNIFSISPYFSAAQRLSNKFTLDSRINVVMNTGNKITRIGTGDLYVNVGYKPISALTMSLAYKLPLSKADKQFENKVLPLDYQSTLGTHDVLAGVRIHFSKLSVLLVLQQPVSKSTNEFIPTVWDQDTLFSSLPNTNRLDRKGDLMARIGYPFQLSNNVNMTASLVPIYHLGEDEYRDENGDYLPIVGSDGLTVNASMFFEIKLGERKNLGVTVGFPLVVREVRPDGLTRSFVLGVEYQVLQYK